SNTGDDFSILNWFAEADKPWIFFEPAAGTIKHGNEETITFSVDITGLTTGSYTATLTFWDNRATNSPVELIVTVDIGPRNAPEITLNKNRLVFNGLYIYPSQITPEPEAPATKQDEFILTNTGDMKSLMDWKVSTNVSWLSFDPPTSGNLAYNESSTIKATVKTMGLVPDIYKAEIIVESPWATNNPQIIEVIMELTDEDPMVELFFKDLSEQPNFVAVKGGSKGYVNPNKGEQAEIIIGTHNPGMLHISIYTLQGSLVWNKEIQSQGNGQSVFWNCLNQDNSTIASGVYIVHVQGSGIEKTQKIAIVQ
ncbi:MAG: T9SS type A sorting domain-containing protein, partial [Elusimicrobia bacterium]|nr:T9SS type A sorting domain-containing protein [Elusimicrobiota bacterium]